MLSLWDTHMHSDFSGDANTKPENMIAAAKALSMPGITFTDHLDLDYREEPGLFDLDVSSYHSTIKSLSEKESTEDFSILLGIELGLQPHAANAYELLLKEYSFDFVIGSTHVIRGEDPYYPKYFSTRDEKTAFLQYYEMILENIQAFDQFDSLGHLDYCFRYGPYARPDMDTYTPYAEIVDAILSTIIKKDIALEVNTGSFRCGLMEPNPCIAIIKRYRELGGYLLTIGSDAHKTEHIGLHFDGIPDLLKDCGFKEYHVYKNRTPIAFPLD